MPEDLEYVLRVCAGDPNRFASKAVPETEFTGIQPIWRNVAVIVSLYEVSIFSSTDGKDSTYKAARRKSNEEEIFHTLLDAPIHR